MTRRRTITTLIAALALAAPAPALAQGGPAPLEEAPPAGEDRPKASERSAGPQLPDTGSDAWLVGLAGAGMLMAGAGLRLRVSGD